MRAFVTALFAATPLAAIAAPAQMAYYEGSGSNTALQAEEGVLNIVAADLFGINAAGAISGKIPANVTAAASANHIALYAVISNYAGNGFKPKIATAILTPGAAQNAAIANMLTIASTTAGINLDFEAVPHKERALYTAFAQRLATALHAAGRKLVLSIPATTADLPKDSWTGAYDYAALGGIADTLQVMTYDENGPWGAPGPVAGLDWVTACLTYSKSVVPLTRISLGMPAYGYDWNLTAGTGTTVNWNQIPALLTKTGATPQWNAATASPWFSYTASNGASHVVWYENAQSIQLKASLAASSNVASVSVWALGLDDPTYWAAIAAGFATPGSGEPR
jgi:spore germination protein YaaH